MAFIIFSPSSGSFLNTNVKNFQEKAEKKSRNQLLMSSDNTWEQKEISGENKPANLKIPGKIILSEIEINEREKKLKLLSDKWKKERIAKEELERKLFGFTKNSEILNGRMAMFFLTTGLLTELWTKQSIISQIDTMVRTLGLL